MAIIKSKFNIKNGSGGIDTYYYDNYASQVHLDSAITGLTSTTAFDAIKELNSNDIYRGATAPTSPKVGTLWLDTSDGVDGLINYIQFDPNGRVVYNNNEFAFYGYGNTSGYASGTISARSIVSYESLKLFSGPRMNSGYIEYFTNNTNSNRTAWMGFGSTGTDTFMISNEKGGCQFAMYNNGVYMGPNGTSSTWYGIMGRDNSRFSNSSKNMSLFFDNTNNTLRLENTVANGSLNVKAGYQFIVESTNYIDNKFPFVLTSDPSNKMTTYSLDGTSDSSGISVFNLSPHVKADGSRSSALLQMLTYGSTTQEAAKANLASIDNVYGPLYVNSRNAYPTYIGGTRLDAPFPIWCSIATNTERCANILAGHAVSYSGDIAALQGYGPTAINCLDTSAYHNSMIILDVNKTASFVVTKYEGVWHSIVGFSFGSHWETDARYIPKYMKIEICVSPTDDTTWITIHEDAAISATLLNTFISFNKSASMVGITSFSRVRVTVTSTSTYATHLTNFKIYGADLAGDYNTALMGARQGTIPANCNENISPSFGDWNAALDMVNGPVTGITDPNGVPTMGMINVKSTGTNRVRQEFTPVYDGTANYGYIRTGLGSAGGGMIWGSWYLTTTESPMYQLSLVSPAKLWSTIDSSYANPTVKRVGQMVYLNGLVVMSAAGTGTISIATLPAEFRPARNHLYTVANDACVYIRLDVFANGNVVVYNTSGRALQYVSLDGISFPIGPRMNGVTP